MAQKMNIVGADSGNNYNLPNHVFDVYSKEILFQAQPNLRFLSVCNKQTELGALPGTTIKFLRYNSLTGSYVLTEGTPMDTDVLSSNTISITVTERGKALQFSEYLLRSTPIQILTHAATLLGMHYAKSLDGELRDVFSAGSNVKYSQKGGNAVSRANLIPASVLDINGVRDIAEFLATKKAPKFGGDAYVGFIHPHQARFLRADPHWVNVQDYADPSKFFTGEIGRLEDIRFIQTTNIQYIPAGTQDIFADGVDTTANTAIAANASTDVYRSVFCGDYAIGYAEALAPEMRDNGVQDFGRQHSLGYYGIWGAGLIETNHSIILETA